VGYFSYDGILVFSIISFISNNPFKIIMCSAEHIIKLGNAPQGGKLKANFDCNPMPKFARVKENPSDVNHVTPSGNWISRDKYQTPMVTLELLDGNQALMATLSFDINGLLIPVGPTCLAIFADPVMFFDPEGNQLGITFILTTERGVASYQVEKRGELDSSFSNVGDPILYNADNGGAYELTVPLPNEGVLYRVKVNFQSCEPFISEPTEYFPS
jgi:hypothetical protein